MSDKGVIDVAGLKPDSSGLVPAIHEHLRW